MSLQGVELSKKLYSDLESTTGSFITRNNEAQLYMKYELQGADEVILNMNSIHTESTIFLPSPSLTKHMNKQSPLRHDNHFY